MSQANNILPEKSCGKCVWWVPLARVLEQTYRVIGTTKLDNGLCNNDQSIECGKMTGRTNRCENYRRDW